jgi:16S rRNA (uracil1498-N3)-methyltransferase
VITLLVPAGVAAGRREPLEDAELHHLRVRRAVEGESVALRDGAGLVGTGRLVAAGRGWAVEIEAVERRPPPAPLTLAVGAGDRERFAWLVEKAVELGATAVVPLETEHVRGVATRLRDGHLPKLRRHALEALKQCGAAWAPELPPAVGLDDFLARARDGACWLADAGGAAPPASLDARPVTIVVGPEGGLTERERESLRRAGYTGIALGPHTLRFETAALAAAAAAAAGRLRGTHG